MAATGTGLNRTEGAHEIEPTAGRNERLSTTPHAKARKRPWRNRRAIRTGPTATTDREAGRHKVALEGATGGGTNIHINSNANININTKYKYSYK